MMCENVKNIKKNFNNKQYKYKIFHFICKALCQRPKKM